MDLHLSAILENTPELKGDDIPHDAAVYLASSCRVIVTAVEVHYMNIRSSRWRGGRGRGGGASEAQAGRSPGTSTGRGDRRRRAASNGGLEACLPDGHVPEGTIRDRHQAPQVRNRIHRTVSIGRGRT